MAEIAVSSEGIEAPAREVAHRLWVRLCHWSVVLSFLALAISGFLILMVHPRLYWGHVGNDLTPALLELPISNNHRPEGWQPTVPFTELADGPFSANRTYRIFNQNGWARSLHFLAGWVLVLAGVFYALAGLVTGHLHRDLLPSPRKLFSRALWDDVKSHLRFEVQRAGAGGAYGLLQRCAYASVAFVVLPFMVVTGLAMSPAVTAAYPVLLDLFGGHQSARTLHFFAFAALILFLLVHLAMVVLTGFRRQMRAMIIGN